MRLPSIVAFALLFPSVIIPATPARGSPCVSVSSSARLAPSTSADRESENYPGTKQIALRSRWFGRAMPLRGNTNPHEAINFLFDAHC